MTDRDRLADALALATPEMLQSHADLMMSMVAVRIDKMGLDDWAKAWECSAALLLAIAEMQERPTRVTFADGGTWDDEDSVGEWFVRVPMTMDYDRFKTLPAALANLLRAK